MGITVVPPDVNSSDVDFTVADGQIHFGLSAVKGCGGGASEVIAGVRKQDGPFRDLFDFCERVETSACNRAAIETLIKAGAFDSFGARRSQLSAVLDRAIQSGATALADRRAGQKSLFGGFDEEEEANPVVELSDIPEWEEKEKLTMEKEVLGFYLTSHPLAEHERKLASFRTHATDELGDLPDRAEVVLGGMLSSIKLAHVKRARPGSTNTKYANFDLEDTAGVIRCIAWPEDFARMGHLVEADAILMVRGALDRRGGDEANLIVNELIPLDQLDSKYTVGVRIRIDEAQHGTGALAKVREILRFYPGDRELHISLQLEDGQKVLVKSNSMRVAVDDEMRNRIIDLLGPTCFHYITAPPRTGNGNGARRRGGASV
jgi:DNA polymerase-3 subunit alpha